LLLLDLDARAGGLVVDAALCVLVRQREGLLLLKLEQSVLLRRELLLPCALLFAYLRLSALYPRGVLVRNLAASS
jgi:hypothetical protein